MSTSDNPPSTSKLIYVLPRIRLSGTAFGQDRFSISKATFLPDEAKSWGEVLLRPRPEWLDIYRDFPHIHSNDPPDPARGTLIVSHDEEWLKDHIARLIAVAYILGLEESRWRVPADAFQYSSFNATEQPNDLVMLFTKRSGKLEDLRSLQLGPSLELRGVPSSFRLNLQDEKHAELVRRFAANPYDRLAVACYHLFRSQFDNPVVAPPEQDFAAYCACLEAALDVEGPDYSRELYGKLTDIYGNYSELERWIKGLYSARSVFNHGAAAEMTLEHQDDRIRALAEFRQKHLSWDVLRHLCLDVIRERLQDSLDFEKRRLSHLWSATRQRLRQLFYSDQIWKKVAKAFRQSQSVNKILALTGDEKDEFLELCSSYLTNHRWEATIAKPSSKEVCDTLKPMAAVIGEMAKSAGDQSGEQSAESLFRAASVGDENAIDVWASQHASWEKKYSVSAVGEASRAVAVHTANFFGK